MSQVERARRLRLHSTEAERVLWKNLRRRDLAGWKFRRQAPIGPYIVDFVTFEGKLIVEADGGQHAESKRRDDERSAWLSKEGFRVLRFWNNDVLSNTGAVLDTIRVELEASESPSP